MEGDTSLIIEAVRSASRFLQRDFFELENLQTSEKGTVAFCKKACNKSLQTMCESLSKYYKTIIYDNEAAAKLDFEGKAILIETLDGFENFSRSVPLFATMITLLSKKGDIVVADAAVMNFPALGELYYTERGKGVYVELYSSNIAGAFRGRASGMNNIGEALLATSRECLDIGSKISKNIRMFESYLYSLALLVRGKIDVMLCKHRIISVKGVELFAIESGGGLYTQNDLLMASNFKLHEKIKTILL
jgi:myo-inositol-1(or 4)-monophosphatase